jgi:ABC-2 type transport system permease protein
MIVYQEGFMTWNPSNNPGPHDHPYAIVAHEMGHQWNVPYAAVEGAPIMSESVAWYYGMKVVEQRGPEHLRQLLRFMRQPNPFPPIRRGEPLLRGLDPYLSYRRGPFALYAMSEYIGDDKVNEALRVLLEKHRQPDAPLATTLDLYRELKTVTPDSIQYLLHDLFEVNTYWELEAKQAQARQIQPGIWEVTLELEARKLIYDSAGVQRETPMSDWIEVGVYSTANSEPLYMKKHHIQTGRQTLILNVAQRPDHIGIDPNQLLIDLDPDNNSTTVKGQE